MWRGLALAVLATLVGAVPAAADPSSLYRGPGPRPGPGILYEPLASAPQLTNAGVWQADPILVSGATAYRKGEFLYQDWLYDDHGARGGQRDPNDNRTDNDTFSAPNGTYTYPTDDRYADNAADLVELRVRPLSDATAFRLTYNTMLDPELVATTIALGDTVPAAPFPHGAGVTAPASLFLTVHGGSADLKRAGTLADVGPAPSVTVDRERRQVEVRVPRAAFDPGRSQVRMAAGTGLWDAANGRYLVPGGSRTATTPGGRGRLSTPPAFFNVAFRSEAANPDAATGNEEPVPQIEARGGLQEVEHPSWWRDRAQGEALAAGDVSRFAATVDFGKLADGVEDDGDVPRTGVLNRILASHFEPKQGIDFDRECGTATNCEGEVLGRLQPYALYVPAKPQPAEGYGLTLLLHSLAGNYNQFSGSRNQSQFGDRGPGSLVITPQGRGPDGWYYGLAGADAFEVWADVAARYKLDPDWVAIAGYSMGGYGTYKLAAQYPDLFAKAQPTVGPPTLGISPDAQESTGGRSTSTFFMLPSLRHVPFMMWVGSTDQLVPISGTTAQAQGFDALQYRYVFDVFSPADHFSLAINDQYGPAADFLGTDEVVRDPARVTYVLNPKMDFPEVRTVGDHAYWLSGLRVRNAGGEEPRGLIDVRSEGFGVGDPPAGDTRRRGPSALPDTRNFPLTFVRQERSWGAAPRTPVRDRLRIEAANVSRVRVDVRRARVTCGVQLEVTSDGPLTVELDGCNRTLQFAGGTGRGSAGTPASCRAAVGFVRAGVRPRGPRGSRLRFDAALVGSGSFTVDVFRQSAGRTVVGNRRVARFRGRRAGFDWAARSRRVRDGIYIVRFRRALRGGRVDTRRVVLERRRGRFRVRPAYYRRQSCGVLTSFKLERPVFGGRRNRALGIAFRVARESTVEVRLVRGRRTIRRLTRGTRAGRRTHRLRLPSERLARGDYKIVLRATPRGGRPVTATLTARRL